MNRKPASIILFVLLTSILSPALLICAAKFSSGDIIEVINTNVGGGLRVRSTPAGTVIPPNKYDGSRGMVLDGPINAYLDGTLYTWWKIRWEDAREGWSAEGDYIDDYLLKVYVPPSAKFSIGDYVEVEGTGSLGLSVRTNPPTLTYAGNVAEGSFGKITEGPFYGVAEGKAGFNYFWKVDFEGITGWSAEDWLVGVTLSDLTVEDIWIDWPESVSSDPVKIYTRIKNIGESSALSEQGLWVRVYFDNSVCYEDAIEGLGAGYSYSFQWSYMWPSDAAWHTIKVAVDPSNYVVESYEDNNELSRQFIWNPPPPEEYRSLTVESFPSGVTFQVQGLSSTTPWSGIYSEGAQIDLLMPESFNIGDVAYYWDRWSDGVTNRLRTVTMNTNVILTAYYNGSDVTVHEGDLIVEDSQTYTVEGRNWTQIGNIYVRDNGTLTIRNSCFIFSQTRSWEFTIQATESGRIILENVTLINSHDFRMDTYDMVTVIMKNVSSEPGMFFALEFFASGNAIVEVKDSWMISEMFFMGHANASIEDSSFVNLGFQDYALGRIEGVSAGLLQAYDESHIFVSDSHTAVFFGVRNSFIEIESLEPGLFSHWNSYENCIVASGAPNITLSGVVVRSWGLFNHNSEAHVKGSVFEFLGLSKDSATSVQNSVIDRLNCRDYSKVEVHDSEVHIFSASYFNGSVCFDDVTGLTDVEGITGSHFFMFGNFSFVADASISSWSDSSCIRNFNVVCADETGRPAEGIKLVLSDKFGATVWTGASDNYGGADFNVTFIDGNYTDALQLEASRGGWSTTKRIALLSDTPANIQTLTLPPPNYPPLISPGSSSCPGEEISTLTPTFKWNSVSGADQYGLYIRDMDSNELIFDNQARGTILTETSYTLPFGILEWGTHYRWNMNSHNEAGWGEFSPPLDFHTVGEWTFAIITDLHIGRGYPEYGGENYYLTERLEGVVTWLNMNHENTNIKFLAVLGDISENGKEVGLRKAKEILDRLDIPYIPVIGNHDVWSNGDNDGDRNFARVFDDLFFSQFAARLGVEWMDGRTCEALWGGYLQNYAFAYGGTRFVCLDFVNRDPNALLWTKAKAFMYDSTRTWLQQHLSEDMPVVLLSHQPMIEQELLSESGDYCFDSTTLTDIENVMMDTSGNILANFAGHLHGFSTKKADQNIRLFMDANKNYAKDKFSCDIYVGAVHQYWDIYKDTPAGISVITTEAVMVASNDPTSKGVVRVVKMKDSKIDDCSLVEGEFRALNPSFEVDQGALNLGKTLVEFESYAFTRRFTNEHPLTYIIAFGDGSLPPPPIEATGEEVEFKHYYENGGCYGVTLLVIGWTPDGERISEKITRWIEVDSPFDMAILLACPVDMAVTDPDGLTINKLLNEISGAAYVEVDLNQDGHLEDLVLIPNRKIGDYLITVIPEPDAISTDTYTLEALGPDATIVLAENVQVSSIPVLPYVLRSTATQIIPITWEFVFEDPVRKTMLGISTNDKYFQFVTPDRDYGIRKATTMQVFKAVILINHRDSQLCLATAAIDTRIDFCSAVAWDVQARKFYYLLDKPGIEK